VGPDDVRLFAATHDGRMVAGMIVFVTGREALHAQYIASREDARHLCPVNAVIHHVMTWGGTRGRRYLNLGLSTEEAGRKVNTGLVAFKEGFGARSVLRETMMLTVGS
jgi:lipid II:glycine glycyltransferase (peptidoglycan interpeptide bridge formation enzyme)